MSSNTPISPIQQTVIVQKSSEPGCLVQALWFLFIGWWLGGIVLTIAWVLNITIIGLPFGMALLNNVPKVLALQSAEKTIKMVSSNNKVIITESGVPQINFFVRAAFFLLIGWWWSGIWLGLGYLLCATIILMPIGLAVFRLTPTMTTLRKY